jgi:DNA-binding CsgD family transcriptional regulator
MDRSTFERLTLTQLAVLWLIADHSRGAVAKALGIGSVETVKTHLAAIRLRLAGVDRDEASRALRRMIPHPPPWVSSPWGMEERPLSSPIEPSVHEDRAAFIGFPSASSALAEGGARFEAQTPLIRFTMIASAALKITQAILITLAVCAGASIALRALFEVLFQP